MRTETPLYCMDLGDLKLLGNVLTQSRMVPVISLKIRDEYCINDKSESECITSPQTEKAFDFF